MEYGRVFNLDSKLLSHEKDVQGLALQIVGRVNALVICLSHSWGGLEQVAASDSIGLAALGLKIKVLCLKDSPIHKHLLEHHASLESKSQAQVSIEVLKKQPRNFLDFRMRSVLRKQIDSGVNLIHAHQPTLLGTITPWLWSSPQVALFATRHIMNNHNKKDWVHRSLYKRVDYLIVMSQMLKKNVLETHAYRKDDVQVVHLGLDLKVFDPSKKRLRENAKELRAAWGVETDAESEQTLVVGLVGRIDPAKGQATLIQAAAELLKSNTSHQTLKFVIVGEETLGGGTNHLDELKKMVSDLGLQETVIFAGYHKNVPEVMLAFDIFVMPSKQEAFGLVAIEAMAMKCPVIISSGGSAEEIVGSKQELGLTVRPDDPLDLTKQIQFLIDHPKERKKMAKLGRDHVVAHFDRETRKLRTMKLYDRALRRRTK